MVGNIGTLKILEFVLSVLGLIFTISSIHQYIVYMVFYVAAVTYMLIMIICALTGKSFLGSTGQAVMEIFLGIIILAYSLHVCITCTMDVMLILAATVGFILPAFFFITAYEKM